MTRLYKWMREGAAYQRGGGHTCCAALVVEGGRMNSMMWLAKFRSRALN